MGLPVHRIPREEFSSLAEGRGDVTAASRLVAAQRSKHGLLVRQVVESARAAGQQQAAEARRAYHLLAAIQDRWPDVVDAVLNHPPVASWARHTIRMLRHESTGRSATPAQLAGLAAAAAIRTGAACSVEVPVAEGSVMLPSLGRLEVPAHAMGDRVRIAVCGDKAEAAGDGWCIPLSVSPREDQPGWQTLRQLSVVAERQSLQVLIEDLDAYRMPGSARLTPRLSKAEADSWQSTLDGAWHLLARHHREVAAEVAVMIKAFTPLLAPAHGHVSATSRETFGSIALSAPPDASSLAVTLAHEIQHAKLCALLDVVSLTLPDDGTRYYAPWRDDPRPLSGLLQGGYAFLGVAAFWRRQRHVETGAAAVQAHAEYTRWRAAVHSVVRTLAAGGRLTGPGQTFVAGMERRLRTWTADDVPEEAVALAAWAAGEHRRLWRQRHGEIADTPRAEGQRPSRAI